MSVARIRSSCQFAPTMLDNSQWRRSRPNRMNVAHTPLARHNDLARLGFAGSFRLSGISGAANEPTAFAALRHSLSAPCSFFLPCPATPNKPLLYPSIGDQRWGLALRCLLWETQPTATQTATTCPEVSRCSYSISTVGSHHPPVAVPIMSAVELALGGSHRRAVSVPLQSVHGGDGDPRRVSCAAARCGQRAPSAPRGAAVGPPASADAGRQ